MSLFTLTILGCPAGVQDGGDAVSAGQLEGSDGGGFSLNFFSIFKTYRC
jgi:hypothetical protein